MFIETAYAQAAGAPQPSLFENLFPIMAILMVFWFFVIRPQAKQRRKHVDLIGNLKRGDKVLTTSGILGTIEGLTEKFVTLEIAEQVRIKMLRTQVAGLQKEQE